MSKLKAALDLVPEKIGKLINDYRDQLENAWLKKDDKEDLVISFQAKFGMEKGDHICIVSLAFTPEKITDRTRFGWDVGPLFEKKTPPTELPPKVIKKRGMTKG